MGNSPLSRRLLLAACISFAAAMAATCPSDDGPDDHGFIAAGTWGGDNAGAIVTDSSMHVHIGCTFGDVASAVPLTADGHFDIAGSYLLHAYPVAVGPTMPARFSGRVDENILTLTVTVTDTTDNTVHVLGPATVEFKKTPLMGVCPICRTPADRAAVLRRS